MDNINNLAATLVAGDYLTRATGLAADYVALQAPLARDGATTDVIVTEALTAAASVNASNNTIPADPDASAATGAVSLAARLLDTDPGSSTNVSAAQTGVQSADKYLLAVRTRGADDTKALRLRKAALGLLAAAQAAGSAKPPTIDAINTQLRLYLGPGFDYTRVLSDTPDLVFQQTDWLTKDVAKLHTAASKIFDRMNAWREHSRVTLTSVVPPPGGNAVLNVRIILHEAYAPFTFGTPPKNAAADTSKTSSGTITAAAATGAGPEQHEVRRVLVEVHRKADANLVGAIIGSTIPLRSFGVQPGPASTTTTTTTTTTPNGTTTTSTTGGPSTPGYYYGYESQNDHVQIQGMAGINWYPGGRDFYPGYLRGWRRVIPGFLFGTSVTAPGNFIGGLDFEPTNGFDIILGGEVGPVKQLAPGVTLGMYGTQFAASDVVPTRQHTTGGFVFGIGFDLSVFSAVFGGASSPSSTPAPATPATP